MVEQQDRLNIDNISHEEFEEAIEEYVTWASEWDGSLPADVFFGVWADLQRLAQEAVAETIELTGVVQGDTIVFDSPKTAPVMAHRNEIVIGGLRLVVKLRQYDFIDISEAKIG